jgi:two-component system chemotaxis sensor kinase CheA
LRKGCAAEDAANLDAVVEALQSLLLSPDEASVRTQLSVVLEQVAPEIAFVELRSDADLPPMDPQAIQVFLDERLDSLDELDDQALEYEHSGSADALAGIKRILHSIKGDASLLGLNDVAEHCHQAEDRLVSADRAAAAELIAGTVRFLRARLTALRHPKNATPVSDPTPSAPSHSAASVGASPAAQALGAPPPDDLSEVDADLGLEFLVEAREHLEQVDAQLLNLESGAAGSKEESLNAIFRAFHTIKGMSGFLNLRFVMRAAHEAEALLDKLRSNAIALSPPVVEAAFRSADLLKACLNGFEEALATKGMLHAPPQYVAVLKAVLDAPNRAHEARSSPSESKGASEPAEVSDQEAASSKAQTNSASVKVDSARLDSLIDLIGELVIAQSMVSQSPELDLAGKARLPGMLGQLEKITRELQQISMSLRMVPIRATFRRMARLARDVSKKLGKSIDFVMRGEDTELDKSVVDTIGDPLIHMIRNAIDHGIERDSAQREQAGKPRTGRVELSAFHEGGCIHIVLSDDGRGLDRDAILAKALSRGILEGDGSHLSDSEVFDFIFAPGFSTAQEVTDVSGRGVGLDVVRRNVEALRGRVEIESRCGQGTTFRIRLPLTLAIIDGMVVRSGDERYVVPTLSILRMFRPRADDVASVLERGQLLRVGNSHVPLRRLAELLGRAEMSTPLEETSAVVVESSAGNFAILVDELIGQQQIVIKPLGATVRQVKGLSGGAVMPDGTVGLILDVAGLADLATLPN